MRRLRSHGNAEVDHTPFNSGTTPIREYGLARSNGGQRQRIMVARALMLHPKIIIADEPVSMVDASLRATILENLRELNQVHGISILYITHDPPTAYQIADNIVVLYQGRVAESGDVEKVINDPQHPYTQLLVNSIPQPSPCRASRRPRMNSSGCCASSPCGVNLCAGKSRRFRVTITSARAQIAAARTWRSLGSGRSSPGMRLS